MYTSAGACGCSLAATIHPRGGQTSGYLCGRRWLSCRQPPPSGTCCQPEEIRKDCGRSGCGCHQRREERRIQDAGRDNNIRDPEMGSHEAHRSARIAAFPRSSTAEGYAASALRQTPPDLRAVGWSVLCLRRFHCRRPKRTPDDVPSVLSSVTTY